MSIIITGSSDAFYGSADSLVSLINLLQSGGDMINLPQLDGGKEPLDFIVSQSLKSEGRFFEEEYNTAFMDESLLKKTLEEHGCVNFKKSDSDFFVCEYYDFQLEFYRKNQQTPYCMLLRCNQELNEYNELVDLPNFFLELQDEYKQNAQQKTYDTIKQRLTKHHLSIEDEEILEDDSIMLTVNLD